MAETVSRQIIDVVPIPKPTGRPLRITSNRWIAVLDDGTALAAALIRQLEQRCIACRLMEIGASGDAQRFDGAAGLIIGGETPPQMAFLAAKHAARALCDAAAHGDALFACVTRLDGAFGFSGNPFDNPEQGALAGLVKTAALEWTAVTCRAIDLSPDFADTERAASRVIAELMEVVAHDPVEIGLVDDRRVTLRSVPAETAEGVLRYDSDAVVVVTGGARGVTAACALELAGATGISIALLGRSAAPFVEPEWLQAAAGEASMKKAIVTGHFADAPPSPRDVEAQYRRYAANRAIVQSLEALRAAGAKAAYYSADVTSKEELATVFDAIRREMGPIAGVIHGAGILHDRLIVDKTEAQFRAVYTTKVDGLRHLLDVTAADRLRHLVLFSSVSARTGNTGQCDYAMANEALNKMAHQVSLERPGCRVVAINWGPWDGGMVTPALKKAMMDRSISLIPVEYGARLMVEEMKNADPGNVEVLIGSMLTNEAVDTGADTVAAAMTLLERREVDLRRYPVLASHVIGGRPVVPFALISEWIGHGALKENPGLSLYGIDDFRLLSGIRIDQEKKLVRLLAGKPMKNGDTWHVDVELRNGVKSGKDVIHSRARALLVNRFPGAPTFTPPAGNGSRPFPKDLDTVYESILFHGDQLRAIQSIDAYSDTGMTAHLTNAPKPDAWMQDPIRDQWMTDPLVLDGAFQMAIVWCHEQTGSVCLPSYARAYRQYRAAFPASGVTAVMHVTTMTHRKIRADFTFLDSDATVVATLEGYEATVDQNLIHAFKKRSLPFDINRNVN